MNRSSDYRRVFNRFDEDGDGVISPAELRRRVGSVWQEEVSLEELEIVVGSARGNDGELGFEEFVSLMEGDGEDERLEDLRKAFRLYEMDGSDVITAASLRRMLSRLGESRSVDECVIMIQRFDLDRDGVLNFDEFRAMMM